MENAIIGLSKYMWHVGMLALGIFGLVLLNIIATRLEAIFELLGGESD